VHVEWLEVRDFRNHRELALRMGPGSIAVVGPNGRGKTNLLEAIDYLCSLVSPRVSTDLPLVRIGAQAAYLRGEVVSAAGRTLVEVEIRSSGANRVQMNRSPVRRKRDLRRVVRAVFSGPDDLAVVQGDPSERRRFMDEVVRTLWPLREGTAAAYERVLRQRNRLLKDWLGEGVPPDLEAWDAELAAAGVALAQARADGIGRIAAGANVEFERLAGRPQGALEVRYEPNVPGPLDLATFRLRLAERLADELVRRTSLVGPHRDELGLRVRELVARGFASHGEAWGAALCLRLALAEAVAAEIDERPIVLLDDPFSGLDPERRARLSTGLLGRGQLFLAVPDEAHVPPGATVWCATEEGIRAA
jgi:DNA replication and repair protein RecF